MKKYYWIAKRENEVVENGFDDVKEECLKFSKPSDVWFYCEENIPANDTMRILDDETIQGWLIKFGEDVEKGDMWFYQKVFLYAIITNKKYLMDGLMFLPNYILRIKHFRYVYALFEMSYKTDGVHLSSEGFEKKLSETDKIDLPWKETVLDCYYLCLNSRKYITDEEFKEAIRYLIKKEKYRQYDKEVVKSVKKRKDGKIIEADEILFKYLNTFRDVDSINRPVSLASRSKFVMDEYMSSKICNFNTFSERLNEITGGGWKGETWIIGGFTSDGKTSLAKEIVYNSMKFGDNILFVTLEMLKEEMCQIFEARIAYDMGYNDITLTKIRRRQLIPSELEDYKKVAEQMLKYKNLYIYEPSGRFTMDDLEAEIDRMSATVKIDIVVVDYLELIDPDKDYESYRIQVKQIMRRAKKLATQKNLWVIIPHQISREGRAKAEKRIEPHYIMPDLQESSGVEQNCTVMLWIYQDEKFAKRGRVRIGISKNRMAKKDVMGWEIGADWAHCRFYEDGLIKIDEFEYEKKEEDKYWEK